MDLGSLFRWSWSNIQNAIIDMMIYHQSLWYIERQWKYEIYIEIWNIYEKYKLSRKCKHVDTNLGPTEQLIIQ